MKMQITKWATALLLVGAAATATVNAQDGNKPDGPPKHGKRPMPPLVAALDTNKDGKIDATEIANAPASLKTLDKNGDGELTRDELRPPGMQGMGRHHKGDGQKCDGDKPAPPADEEAPAAQ